MKSYAWRAYTAEGKLKTGLSVASDPVEVSTKLRADGLFPEEITEQAIGTAHRRLVKRLDADMQAVLARQLAVLIDSGLPVDDALSIVQGERGNSAINAVASRARALVREGAPLSEALEAGQSGFPPFVISAIRAGEASRDLASILDTIATHLETRRSEKAVLATALIYPAFVATVAMLVCGILMVTVAPQLADMFEATGRPLPPLTAFMLGATDWIIRNSVGLIAIFAAIAVGVPVLLRRPSVRAEWDRLLLSMPLFGRFMRQQAAAQYLRTLALVISSRQPVLEGVRNATDVLRVDLFREESRNVTAAIEGGSSLSAALAVSTFIPPVALQLVEAGEKSARLAQMTERAAMLIEASLANERKRVATLIDPLLMMLIGVFVLTIVLSVLLPIFDMQSAIQP